MKIVIDNDIYKSYNKSLIYISDLFDFLLKIYYNIYSKNIKGVIFMTVYEKIDRALRDHENHRYATRSLDSIADYIGWAWKWHKITRSEMENAADRVCVLYDAQLEKTIDRAYDGWEN